LYAAKTYFLSVNNDSDLEDFEALSKFVETFPEVMRTGELEQVQEHFLNFCTSYDESWADSPDDIRYDADRIGQVGAVLEVDVSARCADLERQASEWEEDLPPSEEDREDDDDEERWSRSAADDSSAMFEELLDELNERDPS
jgi:hypothetical protein